MYAIRSYYAIEPTTAGPTATATAAARRPLSRLVDADRPGAVAEGLAHRDIQIPGQAGVDRVITSYSIHYTKLYERAAGFNHDVAVTAQTVADQALVGRSSGRPPPRDEPADDEPATGGEAIV